MVDTHCHIYKEYYDNIPELIKEIEDSGITKIIVNGCDMKTNLEVLELAKKYSIVYGAIGFHPTELSSNYIADIQWLNAHINDDKIVAIGEIGLDYHYDNTERDKQIDAFRRQLDIASKYNKPIIVHSRDAINDTYEILKEYNLKGSIHCYSGSLEMANKFINLGYYIGIGGVCTYKNAKNIVKVIKDISLAYILLETDSPYLSPEGFRGEKNSPKNIPIIVNKISEIRGESVKKIIDETNANADRLFDF